MIIRIATSQDLDRLFPLVKNVWSSVSSSLDLYLQFSDMDKETSAFIIAENDDEAVGFASVGLRFEYVEGTKTLPVAYLEGISVKEEHMGKGIAREMIKFCEDWARERNCTEFASDCNIENTQSMDFHKALGFNEVSRNIHFVKQIGN